VHSAPTAAGPPFSTQEACSAYFDQSIIDGCKADKYDSAEKENICVNAMRQKTCRDWKTLTVDDAKALKRQVKPQKPPTPAFKDLAECTAFFAPGIPVSCKKDFPDSPEKYGVCVHAGQSQTCGYGKWEFLDKSQAKRLKKQWS